MKLDIVLLLPMLVACPSCDKREPAPAPSSSSPGALSSAGSGAASDAIDAASPTSASSLAPSTPKDAGPDEWYACKKHEDCVLAFEGRCCPSSCDPVAFAGYTAVNAKHKAHFVAHEGCTDSKCPACPTPYLGTPRSESNFFALCKESRCVAMDLRYSAYSECKTTQDCKLRFGLGCCEACGDKELITYNPASTLEADICPVKRKCPPVTAACRSTRSARGAECTGGYCQLTDQ